MKRASAIVTNRGGRTCHAAIIARELGIPAVVGCGDATERLKDGRSSPWPAPRATPGTSTTACWRPRSPRCTAANALLPHQDHDERGQPAAGLQLRAQMPSSGVGLARPGFIINNNIGVHPKAILDYPNIDADLKKAVESVARGHASPRAFYVDKLAGASPPLRRPSGRARSSCACPTSSPTRYRKLIGGTRYEPTKRTHAGLPRCQPLHQWRLLRRLRHGCRAH